MAILFDARRPVKSARRFAAGLVASVPTEPAPFPTFADADWWAVESNRFDRPSPDEQAGEVNALGSPTRGLIPAALADEISRTSLVGYPG